MQPRLSGLQEGCWGVEVEAVMQQATRQSLEVVVVAAVQHSMADER